MTEQPDALNDSQPGGVVVPGPWTPTVAPGGEGEALHGEVLDQQGNVVVPDPAGPPARRTGSVPLPALPAGGKELARTAGRVVVQSAQGHAVLARRAADAATHAVIREQIRGARARGDAAELAEWLDRLRVAKAERRARVATLPAVLKAAGISTLAALVVVVGVVLTAGILVGVVHPLGVGWGDYWGFVGWLLGLLVTAVTVLVPLAAAGVVPAWLVITHRAGRAADAPSWVATSTDDDVDIVIDERALTQALAALRIKQITDYLKKAPLQYVVPARKDGRGTYALIRLPGGLPASYVEAQAKRESIAASLHRRVNEVWLRTGEDAGLLDVWIADPGALKEGAGPYPLLTDGFVDVFRGVPFGRSLRGDALVAPVMERNTITGGQPGQGKSSSARTILAGASLDITAELRIWVPDTNFDFEYFKPRCSRYVMGVEDDKIRQILDDLRELHAEVQARGQLLVDHEIDVVNRKIASQGVGLHPLFCLLEEAHVAIQHPVYGKEIAQLLIDIVKLGRKRGIHMIVSTQAPTKDSMPRDVTRNCSNGIAYAVGDHVANDALLGQGAYRAGHRATELIPGTDRGTALVKGFTGERSVMAQTYFIDVKQVPALIRRSLDELDRKGLPVPGAPRQQAQPEDRDLLDDLDQVLGTDVIPIAKVPPLLLNLAPTWPAYKGLTGPALVKLLAAEGIKVPSTANRYPLDPVTVREEIGRRATADLDE
ncbi:cell division protein FtsK [Parafrankia colletiae]|uniref:Cell division protein FtsK n=1 Tax=Parafrankia colletiae TaxID=573497 RepID=A0A1S1RN50_9ACTN|nr:cell division protein FtsK [Parafrankia colletiae]MCK9904280.1 cell division protein FtsK [Frankia sp. Cpl3]OHV46214.1 cell division protein FtsK [Parafrankia colletiae]